MGISQNFPTIKPSLLLDFARTQALDPRITFTRASIATRINQAGLLETVSDGIPRFDFDPTTLNCKGLLIEESRQNIQLQSGQVGNTTGAAFGVANAFGTVTLSAATSPDGLTAATSWVEDTSTNARYLTSILFTPALNTYYTISVYAKQLAGTRYVGFIFPAALGWSGGTQPNAIFDLSGNGTVTFSGGSPGLVSAVIQNAGNGWYRCAVTVLSDATTTTSGRAQIRMTSSTTTMGAYTGDGTSGVLLWGAQLEAGAFPTSYIPTTTAAVTRQVDSATMTGANVSSWFDPAEGTFFAEGKTYTPWPGTNLFPYLFQADDGTYNNRVAVLQRVLSTYTDATYVVTAFGTNQANFDTNTNTTVFKFATAVKPNDFAFAVGGRIVSTDGSGINPAGINTLIIGAPNSLNGHISKIAYYPARLTNTQLVALTGA